jgi:hypothetical protein
MKVSLSHFWRSGPRPTRSTTRPHESPVAVKYPAPGEVLAEIGLLLAIHLAVAFAVVVTLRVSGIA